jgi:alpha-L-fucosidase 2
VEAAHKRLVPPQIGKMGNLQEWADDWPPKERSHRHFSHMYGLYPGNVLSAKRTPEFIDPCKEVLEQRGDGGTGFSRAWKMALWARLYDGERGLKIFKGYLKEQACPQLFAKCFSAPQVDGTFGVGAAITEMIMQSHEGVIDLLPALPSEWNSGSFEGVCARGGFELDLHWDQGMITETRILSRSGEKCAIDPGVKASLSHEGKKVRYKTLDDGSIEFDTKEGETYLLSQKK